MKHQLPHKNELVKQILCYGFFYLALANAIQSRHLWADWEKSITYKVYLIGCVLSVFVLWLLCLRFLLTPNNVVILLKEKFKTTNIPTGARWAVSIVLLGNLISIAVGKPSYPFYDVGMFRWTVDFIDAPAIVYKPKYYYYLEGEVKVFDLRKEGYYSLSGILGLGYTHEFTFSANYHNKGQKENFEYLLGLCKQHNIDTL